MDSTLHQIHVFEHSSTHDVDDYLRRLSGWEIECTQLSKSRFSGETSYLKTEGFEFFDKTTHGVLLKTGCSPRDTVTLGIPRIQSGPACHNGQMLAQGSMVVLTPSTEFELRTPDYFKFLVISLDVRKILPLLDAKASRWTKQFCPAQTFVVRSRHTASLARQIEQVLGTVALSQSANNPGTLPAQNLDALLGAVAASLNADSSYETSPTVAESRRRLVNRARRHIDEMMGERLKVSDICHHLGTEPRTLQNSFNEVLGVSPNAYIKAVRLSGTRRALKSMTSLTGDIGDIAFRWGFWHLSQFAKDYKMAFGELPSETRNRATADFRLAWPVPETGKTMHC